LRGFTIVIVTVIDPGYTGAAFPGGIGAVACAE
jgi:deoxycytidine triphosphate deaminase